jgi:DnaK suppressor protein
VGLSMHLIVVPLYLTVQNMTTKINRLSNDMDKKKLESFKKRLEERQQALRKTVSRTEEDGRIADQDTAQDIADRAASSYTKEFLFSQSNNDRQLLAMVETALLRIREGEFGECVSCGNEINAKRLEAVPWTRYCIECQEKLEKGQLEEAHD